MGEAKFYLGYYLEAVQNMDAAIELDPNLQQAWYYKGLSLYGQHKPDEARQALIRAVSLDISLHKKLWNDLELVEPYQTVLWSFMKTIPAEGNKKADSYQNTK